MRPSKRVPQEVKLAFRYLADSCLLLVDRELQLAHDLAQPLQRLFGIALLAQDHEVHRHGRCVPSLTMGGEIAVVRRIDKGILTGATERTSSASNGGYAGESSLRCR